MNSLYDAMVGGELTDKTFTVDAEAMHFIFEEIARLGLTMEGDARIVAGVQRVSSFDDLRSLFRELAASGKSVTVVGFSDVSMDEEPGIQFCELDTSAPLAGERFLIFQSPGMTATLIAREHDPAPLEEPPAERPLRRLTGVWSFAPDFADATYRKVCEMLPDIPPPLPTTGEVAWRADLLTALMARIIRRMEEQKLEIAATLEEFESAATEVEIEAWRDPQSWLPTRHYFIDRLEDYVKRAQLTGFKVSMLTLGITWIDATTDPSSLRGFGSAVSQIARSGDFLGHLGDGVIGIGAPGVEIGGAESFARRIGAALRDFARQQSSDGTSALTIGAAQFDPTTHRKAEDLVAEAEARRARALERGEEFASAGRD